LLKRYALIYNGSNP